MNPLSSDACHKTMFRSARSTSAMFPEIVRVGSGNDGARAEQVQVPVGEVIKFQFQSPGENSVNFHIVFGFDTARIRVIAQLQMIFLPFVLTPLNVRLTQASSFRRTVFLQRYPSDAQLIQNNQVVASIKLYTPVVRIVWMRIRWTVPSARFHRAFVQISK